MVSAHEKRVLDQVVSLVEPAIEDEGYQLVDATYRREPVGWVLRAYVDREGGITVGECARISRRIGDLIEAKNLIGQSYTLEVSSPGLDRPLKRDRDFNWALGKKVRLVKKHPEKGEQDLIGRLVLYSGDSVTIDQDGEIMIVPIEQIAKASIFVDF